jgi:hypothetical protein
MKLLLEQGLEGPHVQELRVVEDEIVRDVISFYRARERQGMTFRTLWPVGANCGKQLYLELIDSYAERFGNRHNAALSYAPRSAAVSLDNYAESAAHAEFSYLGLSKPGISFILRAPSGSWSPAGGLMGIVAWSDMSDVTHELFSLTAAEPACSRDLFNRFYGNEELVLPDEKTPSADQTLPQLAAQR